MNKIIFLLTIFLVIANANLISLSPLTAILKNENIKEAVVTINPKDDEIPLVYKTTDKIIKKYGGVPIFGLYEDFENKIDITYKINDETKNDTFYLQTESLTDKKIKINNAKFDDRFYFAIDKDSVFIIDTMGNVRWFAKINKLEFVEKIDEMLILDNMAFDIINGKTFMINTADSAKLLNINDNIFTINDDDIVMLNKNYEILHSWKFPFKIDIFDDISSLDYGDGLFVAYKDSIIKLDKKSQDKKDGIEWIFGGEKNEFSLVDATGSKVVCEDCDFEKIENMQEIGFLNNKDIIYMMIFDNINAKAFIYKLDEKLKTSEILWQYEIKDEVLSGSAIYREDSHSIFINYKDINKNLHILEFAWGQRMPKIDIQIDDTFRAMPFGINEFLGNG